MALIRLIYDSRACCVDMYKPGMRCASASRHTAHATYEDYPYATRSDRYLSLHASLRSRFGSITTCRLDVRLERACFDSLASTRIGSMPLRPSLLSPIVRQSRMGWAPCSHKVYVCLVVEGEGTSTASKLCNVSKHPANGQGSVVPCQSQS